MDRTALFTGAGISVPGGLPSTTELTKKILKTDLVTDVDCWPAQDLKIILAFLEEIKDTIKPFYQHREVNYEDIYCVISQINDCPEEYNNPVVSVFMENLKKQLNKVYLTDAPNRVWDITELASYAGFYVNYMVTYLLVTDKQFPGYLSFVRDMVRDQQSGNITIFTLNHDTLLEDYLSGIGISYYDGFYKNKNGQKYWKPALFLEDCHQVRLLKLHGSINWFRNCGKRNNQFIKKENGCNSSFDFQEDKLPLILIGKFNKLLEYNKSIYVDLHYYFYRILPEINNLIITGYSFHDEGINSWIINWMDSSVQNRVFLIGPNIDKTIDNTRHDIKESWGIWQDKKRAFTYQEPIERASWFHFKEKYYVN